ncbi:DISARM system helicase DrmA (plasmid) [Synechococcus elongatus IITB7]|uniref:DISARM system helicase DrmA n=1 Tax=Synechococcus elongatus TaxID=32046 RepID=UPI0030D5633F
MPLDTSAEVRDHLVEALALDLIGPAPEQLGRQHEHLPQPPSVWYTTGFLVPHVFQQDIELANLGGEDTSNDAANRIEEREGDEDGNDDVSQDSPSARSWFPSSLGLSFLVNQGTTLKVTATWGDYEAPPSDAPPEDRTWARIPRQVITEITIDQPDVYSAALEPDGMSLRWIVRPAPEQLGYLKDQLSVSLFLLNQRPAPSGNQIRRRDPVSAFQARLQLWAEPGFIPRHDPLQKDERKDGDEQIAALQYRNDYSYASGHNVAVLVSHVLPGMRPLCQQLTTTWLPTETVKRVLPEPRMTVPIVTSMEALADLGNAKQLQEHLQPMVKAYRSWIASQPCTPIPDEELNQTANSLKRDAEICASRIDQGIKLLSDPQVLEAFRTANQVMARAQRQRNGFNGTAPSQVPTPEWRFFQLAFILMNLPGLADVDSPEGRLDRETVELLFFPTGGGKTEAYLGLAAFTLVLRRLRNPSIESAGVAVLMRYTLRLLTLDQLGRAATLICALELERQARLNNSTSGRPSLGDWPFEIGMWVGKSATPNRLGSSSDNDRNTAYYKLNQWKSGKSDRPIPIENCPWCNRPLLSDGFFLLPSKQPERMDIYCREPKKTEDKQAYAHMGSCPFTKTTPLPILAVDDQIYRRLPCFLISTIDKFAALPWLGRTSALFGNVSHYKPTVGFWGPGEPPPQGSPLLRGRLLPPELIIQDELHLISGPLGTLAGLYETAIEALMRPEPDSLPPKIIASTATVRRAAAQIRALFGRSQARVFPPPGPERDDNFFSHTVDDPNQGRLYVGLSAPGRNLKGVLLRTYLALMAAAQKAWDENRARGASNPADPYMTLLGYFSNLKELGVTRSILQDELGAQLPDFATNRALANQPNLFAKRPRPEEPEELTSRESTAKVSATKARLALPYVEKGHLDVALATNMISVGLDISRLGLMVVLNQPKTAAEYIQATSRVGRQLSPDPQRNKPGLVITLLNPNRPRDRSHFENFPYWHQCFYRDVEATSCTPFANRALDRGLPGVTVALARHLQPGLTPASGAMQAEAVQAIQEKIADLFQERCQRAGAADHNLEQLTLLRAQVKDLLSSWWAATQDFERLQYWTHEVKGQGLGLLHTPLDNDTAAYMDDNLKKFVTNWSLRDVEPVTPIRMVDFRQAMEDE